MLVEMWLVEAKQDSCLLDVSFVSVLYTSIPKFGQGKSFVGLAQL